jgi:hypothetical protein
VVSEQNIFLASFLIVATLPGIRMKITSKFLLLTGLLTGSLLPSLTVNSLRSPS